MKTYIIAGNFKEYVEYARKKAEAGVDITDYVYVFSQDTILGTENVSGFFVGTYKNRADIARLKIVIGASKR